jgi:hypothetical protein
MKSLPLTPFETYLYEDDIPAHPCWQIVRLRWKGHFKREEMGRAWAETARLHPLWNAVVRRGFLGRLRWEIGATAPELHWCRRDPAREWPAWLPLDLERGPGVRLYIVEDDERSDAVLCAHHAVCDGLSLLDLFEDVFLRYAKSLGDPVEPKPTPTDDALRRRGHMGVGLLERCWLPLLQAAGILAEAKLLRRTVAPLVPHTPAPASSPRPDDWPALVYRIWSDEESAAIRNAAKEAKAGLPETFMRDLQAAIGAWRLAQGVDVPDDWIRLGTAVSLRRKTKGSWPAANLFGIAVIDRSAKQLANRERLLRRAREDMKLVDEWRFGYAFWMLLSLRRWWPGGIRGYARRPVVRMTAILSFMGKVYSRTGLKREGKRATVPGAVLEEVHGIAPTRPGTCACMDLAIFYGRLEACLHFDPRVITRAQADALMAEFAAQLARTAAGS